jgi:FkbM family methyltransferase
MLRRPIHRKEVALKYVLLGTDYGGWPLLRETKSGSLIYSFGLGEDISFDLAAIARFECRVLGFDPTPRSIQWMGEQHLPSGFSFHQIGIADFDGVADFLPPEKDSHVSFSMARPDHDTKNTFRAEVLRLDTIIDRMNTGVPDILKMDIEGFEFGVVKDIIASATRPKQLLVEFHHGMYGISTDQTIQAVSLLRDAGYRLFYVSSNGHEYGFAFES